MRKSGSTTLKDIDSQRLYDMSVFVFPMSVFKSYVTAFFGFLSEK